MRHGQGWVVLSALLCLNFVFGVGAGAGKAGEWSLPDSRLGTRTAPLLLLSRPDVQADLRLEAAQIAGARSITNELTQRALALRGKSGAEVIAARRAIDEAQADWLTKNLSGNQLARLRQIELQWEGASAMLSRPTVAEYLKLTPEQRQVLVRAISERNAQRAHGQSSQRDEAVLNQRAQAVLSKTQQELWTNLVGAPCRFALTGGSHRTRDDATQRAGHIQERR
jgi:hypothetical protein